mmetsp:Transcript_6562/g.16723  ORF Transcript_6562/g.16723 Transcript_6562/m.16723 type:complete len:140 (-) Transcript_6562:249-668(-)
MAPSKAMSALAPWFARICGTTQARTTTDHPEWPEKPRPRTAAKDQPTLLTSTANHAAAAAAKLSLPIPAKDTPATQQQEVHIDPSTAVPYDLYKDLVRAGRRAKARGQHELKVSPAATSARCPRGKKMHLVRPPPGGTW